MRVTNIHETVLRTSLENASALIGNLASRKDRLWPTGWPPMKLDRPLGIGAAGGHGPIRYFVEALSPVRVVFRFTGPAGFDGTHGFDLEETPDGIRIRHTILMNARGIARLSWPLLFRPLHNALIEDGMARGRKVCGMPAEKPTWSRYVRLLRWFAGARQGTGVS